MMFLDQQHSKSPTWAIALFTNMPNYNVKSDINPACPLRGM